jgi:ubiquinone/menaquinone biosynthesis C-methylase UbiE
MFLRKPAREREPLPVAMSGVRLGERVLQIGIDDAAFAGALVAKTGLSGHAVIVVASDADAERARRSAANAGALADVHVAPLHALPLPEADFDVVVVHARSGLMVALDADARGRMLAECLRVLRHGGRLIVVEAGHATGLRKLLGGGEPSDTPYEQAGGSVAALESAQFRAVRRLADCEGLRFTEGLKG